MSTVPTHQLIVIRRLFVDAEHLAAVGDDIRAMQATLILDLAVESFLGAVIHHLDPNGVDLEGVTLQTMWKRASDAVALLGGKRLPLFNKAKHLRRERNCVQHDAARRHPVEVQRLVAQTREVLVHGYQLAFGIDFTTFTAVDGIANLSIRAAISEALIAVEKNENAFARAVAVYVHDEVVEVLRDVARLRADGRSGALNSARYQRAHEVVAKAAQTDLASLTEELHLQLVGFRDEIVGVGLGLSLGDVRRFLDMAGPAGGRQHRGIRLRVRDVPRDLLPEDFARDVRFMVGHVIDLVSLAEVANPLGIADVVLPMDILTLDEHLQVQERAREGARRSLEKQGTGRRTTAKGPRT